MVKMTEFTDHRSRFYDANTTDQEQTIVEQINYKPINIFDHDITLYRSRYLSEINVIYSPKQTFAKRLMERVERLLKTKYRWYRFKLLGVDSEQQIIDTWKKSNVDQFGVVFESNSEKKLFYKLSVSDLYFKNAESYQLINERYKNFYYFNQSNDYLYHGFSALQLAIDLSHISLITNTSIDEDIEVAEQQLPIPLLLGFNKMDEIWPKHYIIITVLIILFGLLVMLPVTVKRIVEEKQTSITDYLFLLGVKKIDHWMSVIVDAFCVIGLQHLIITLILSIKIIDYYHYHDTNWTPIVVHSHSLLFGIHLSLFLFFSVLFLIQSILFVSFISVFFRSPNIAVIVTILSWIITFFVPIIYLFGRKAGSPALELFGSETISCLLPNCALFWFLFISVGLEMNTQSGANWSNLFSPGYLIDETNLAHIMMTMVISYVIYCLLIWYFSSVLPSKHSNPKPFYFPLKCIYDSIITKFINKSENYETMSETQNYAVFVQNLSKSYKSMFGFKNEKILKNIGFQIEKNSITVILGPNGSGKTTLINILTGLTESKGSVFIDGHHIHREQEMARNVSGICPQQNVFFKFLTLREHLLLFNDLKRVLRKRTDGYDGQQLIDALDLKDDINKEAINLSGGTLRRMVLAMALIGPNDVLLLDEPSASLDPKVRQKVWDLIIDSRKTKSILITSHHLEEANLLSDQIIIISKGKVCFNGSTLQMKKQFDSGYHLKVLKDSQMQTENQIRETVSKFVKIKKFRKNEQGDNEELVFEIDFNENPKLSELFDELQNNSGLAINNISLGMTTLEDSYAKIVQNRSNDLDHKLKIEQNNEFNDNLINNSNDFNKTEENNWKLILRQLCGILIKRFEYLSKHYILLVTLLVIPFIFLMLFFFGIEFTQTVRTLYKKPILLNSQQIYGKSMKAFVVSDDKYFTNIYSNTLKDNGITKIHLNNDSDIEGSLVSYSRNNLFDYFQKLLYGISTDKTSNKTRVRVWYNFNAYHSLPISLNLMTNSLLKQLTEDNSYEIKTSNSPLPIFWHTDTSVNKRPSLYQSGTLTILTVITFIFGLTFSCASYVLLPISERRTKFKLLQYMSGLKPVVYWWANFMFDFTLHSICCIFYALIYELFDKNEYFIGSEKSFISTYLIFSFYGFAFIPFAYLVSLLFSKPSSGFTFISLYNIIMTPIVMSLIAVIEYSSIVCNHTNCWQKSFLKELLVFINPFVVFITEIDSLHQILIYDNYCQTFSQTNSKSFCEGLTHYRYNDLNYFCCLDKCNSSYSPHTELKTRHVLHSLRFGANCYQAIDPIGYIAKFIFLFIIHGLLYFSIIIMIEINIKEEVCKLINKIIDRKDENIELQVIEPTEVTQESENVSRIISDNNFEGFSLIVHKLTKKLNNSLIIPNNISFLVNKEECFGLLGTNGSGKTTTFRLLTGDLSISSGNAYLGENSDLRQNKANFFSRIGYCPQNDALLDRLTGMQTLLFFGRIRGLDSKQINSFIKRIVKKFELKETIDKRLSTYSGGNRLKLSLAIALMGNTKLLLLDEPTTGVDPESRIKIWQLLRDLMNETKVSVLLTSHNMDECEVLCNRLAIVSNGTIKAIGFINQLKNTFAKGFVIILKLRSESNVESLKTRIRDQFGSNCDLKYENFGVIYYNLVSDAIRLSQIFSSLEVIKNEFNLEDYFVSNATLEQVFHSVTKSNSDTEV